MGKQEKQGKYDPFPLFLQFPPFPNLNNESLPRKSAF